jgi:iron complex transport system substrate-binding protein
VSLAPSVTEMLFRLGVEDRLVGVTDCCDYPPAAKQIECVGGFGQPNIERLLALAPDLVLADGLERNDIVPTLRRSGIRVLDLRTRTIGEMLAGLRQIGEAVGQPSRAAAVAAAMEAELEAVAAGYRDLPREQLPRVFVEIWDNPLTTAGGDSYLDDVLTRAGGVNVAHEIREGYFHVNPEKVIEWNPDVIVATHMTQPGAAAGFAGRIGWSGIAAVRSGRIIDDVSPDFLFRPGPRLIEGVRALAQRLHGTPAPNGLAASKGAAPCP